MVDAQRNPLGARSDRWVVVADTGGVAVAVFEMLQVTSHDNVV
jgi:hypothetical protein